LTRSSPLMPWAAPMTAIWTGFFGFIAVSQVANLAGPTLVILELT
jgi:hypothetical protein